MKPLAAIAVLLLVSSVPGWANGGEDFPFHVGEKLTYQIFWGPFVAGRAVLSVDGIEQVDGRDCYHLIAQARTTGLADFMFHVDSKTESWLDVAELFTRRYRESRTEGRHKRSTETRYDYVGKLAATTNFISGRTRSTPLDGPMQDVVSLLYYVRTTPLAVDIESSFPLHVYGTNYTVNVRPDLRKTLWLRPLGDVSALRIEPHPTLSIVAANKGRMWFWVSDDHHRFPVLLTSDMKIGSAKFVLYQVETANPVDAKGLRAEARAGVH
jgi:hypothetical protein